MLISYLLHVAAGGQQVAVGPPAAAPVLEEVGKCRSTELKREGGTNGSKAAFVQPAERTTNKTSRRESRDSCHNSTALEKKGTFKWKTASSTSHGPFPDGSGSTCRAATDPPNC